MAGLLGELATLVADEAGQAGADLAEFYEE